MKSKTNVVPIIISISLFMMLISFGEQKAEWKGKIEKENGVKVIKNPKVPIYKANILTLEEELSLGGTEAKGVYSFSQIRSLAVDKDEYIYILDEKEVHVKVFDKNGKYLRTIGQKGQGPGDLNNPGRISIYRVTNELMVRNGSQGISFFSRDGEFLRNITTIESKRAFLVKSDSKGSILLNLIETKGQDRPQNILKKFSPDINLISELASSPAPSPYDLLAPRFIWTLDEKDNVYYSYPEDYEIRVVNPQGKLFKRIIRDYNPVKTSEKEKEEYLKELKNLRLPPDLIAKVNISSVHSAFRRFIVDEDGRIFVENWEKTKDGKSSFFDIFDSAGKYIAKIPFKPHPLLFKKNKLYSLEEDEGGYHVIKRYKITWII
jgi:hypothetical protein